MKVCYVDDSGNPAQDRIFVMVGIVADAIRLNKSSRECTKLFDDVRTLVTQEGKQSPNELKGSRILYGKDAWKHIDPEKRKQVFSDLSEWLCERKHDIIISAIDTSKSTSQLATAHQVPEEIVKHLWVAAGLNIAVQLQTKHRGEQSNKGNTFLFIDDNCQKLPELCKLLWTPPDWLKGFYPLKKKEEQLDQIIDTAFAVRSHHCSLVQAADLLAFIVRRHLELLTSVNAPAWDEEPDFIKECLRQIAPRIYRDSGSMKNTNVSHSATWYRAIAPEGYDKLLKGKVE
jgi:hypothetical protein